jgi:hypothetical protein
LYRRVSGIFFARQNGHGVRSSRSRAFEKFTQVNEVDTVETTPEQGGLLAGKNALQIVEDKDGRSAVFILSVHVRRRRLDDVRPLSWPLSSLGA